jgi:predicted nucleotidyltransferase
VDLFTQRIAEQMAHAKERALRLRAAVPSLAHDLRVRGATKVILVGSLARGDAYNVDTDVDLIVWGLSLGDAYVAGCELSETLGARVEVIPFEVTGPRLHRAIETEGIDVTERDVAS